ncbi:MAG: hypothetical protein HYV27_25540 [Candidatus Hydrogenedentes bacterium]|nr:hypothetical protein [Candidatus Hydrogenedentota bacterium]
MSTSTPSSAELAQDLAYVRNAVHRHTLSRDDLAIALLWAIVNLIGLSLYDWSTRAGGLFWLTALPVFGAGTWFWAARRGLTQGEANRDLGQRHALHWTAIPIFLILANFVHLRGFDPVLAGQIVLLIIGLVYYLGGVHFWRGYCFGGIALASGVIWLSLLDQWAWTLTGVLTFLGLAVPALWSSRKMGHA